MDYLQFTQSVFEDVKPHITAVYCAKQHKLPSDVSIVILHVVKCVGLWITVRLWITLLTVHTSVFDDIKPHSHHNSGITGEGTLVSVSVVLLPMQSLGRAG